MWSHTVTTLTAHRNIAHQASFVRTVTSSSCWWHSRVLAAGLWPLRGGLAPGPGLRAPDRALAARVSEAKFPAGETGAEPRNKTLRAPHACGIISRSVCLTN